MKEDLIQFIWRTKTLLDQTLYLTTGMPVSIINPGLLNANQGPDFLYAQIIIDEIIWNGHIEIHLKSSDWNLHQHDHDPNYQNIILHVVWEHDQEVTYKDRVLPCLELKKYTDSDLLSIYEKLFNHSGRIACSSFINQIPLSLKTVQLERMMVERLEQKTEMIKVSLENNQWDWEDLFYKKIAHYLVAPVNSDAMDCLSTKISRSLLLKNSSELFDLQALFFGTAGFLDQDNEGAYFQDLKLRFQFQKLKFQLETMGAFEWKLLRLRPAHFPALRIAQLSGLFFEVPYLFSTIIESQNIKAVYSIFNASPGNYWNCHYSFAKLSKSKNLAQIGQQTKDILIINVVIPFLFAYGTVQQIPAFCNKALEWIQLLKAEKNNIVYMWKSFNFALDNAGHSQGGLQLYRSYCMEKKCSSCLIGNEILNPTMKHVHVSC